MNDVETTNPASDALTPVAEESVLDALRGAIISGNFVPGQRMVEADLCVQFDAPRSVVRGALIALSHERLIERVPNRGAVVRIVSLEEAIEITEVRMVLDVLCAGKAAQRVTDGEIDELRSRAEAMASAVAQGDVLTYARQFEELHTRVREISGQKTALETLSRLNAQMVRHQFPLALQPDGPRRSLPEHLRIIESICSRWPEAAEQAMRSHLVAMIERLATSDRLGGQLRSRID